MGSEPEYIAETLNHPGEYVMPCYLALGYPEENACISEQKEYNIDSKIHMNQW